MKRMFLGIEEAQKLSELTGNCKFEEKRAATDRRMKSSPILGHPPNSFLTRGRGFQSSPIGRVNRGVGNTGQVWANPLRDKQAFLTLHIQR